VRIIGYLYLAGAIYTSLNNMQQVTLLLVILACYYLTLDKVDEIKDKLDEIKDKLK
jgi:hypothetical protein